MLVKPDLNTPLFRIFSEVAESVRDGICPDCLKPVMEENFFGTETKKEYTACGLCEGCQTKKIRPAPEGNHGF